MSKIAQCMWLNRLTSFCIVLAMISTAAALALLSSPKESSTSNDNCIACPAPTLLLFLPDQNSAVPLNHQIAVRSQSYDIAGSGIRFEELYPGKSVQNYQLIEKTADLGMCDHQMYSYGQDIEIYGQNQACPVTGRRKSIADPEMNLCPYRKTDKSSHTQSHAAISPSILPTKYSHRTPLVAQTAGPQLEYQCQIEDIDLIYINEHYRLRRKFDAGSHGEVWRATGNVDGVETTVVLKRLFVELGEELIQMGFREAYFGDLLREEAHVARYIEHFLRFSPEDIDRQNQKDHSMHVEIANRYTESNQHQKRSEKVPQNPLAQELWLVYLDEGISLRRVLYAKVATRSSVMFEPSPLWKRFRQDAEGEAVLKEIMKQILKGVAALHSRGITHRDIKPSNILIAFEKELTKGNTQRALEKSVIVKLADFGSAVDAYTFAHLYHKRPSQSEETREYQPPEVLFSDSGQSYDPQRPQSYDLWSVGIVFLEMLLGSPQVFLISPRDRAKLEHKLRGKDEKTKLKSYLLHVIAHQYCIFQPEPSQFHDLLSKYALITNGCHFGQFNLTVIERDPFHKGFENRWGLDLLWKLLQWHPHMRIAAHEALEHAFFKGPYTCSETKRAFATRNELNRHKAYLAAERKRQQEAAYLVRDRVSLPQEYICPKCKRSFASYHACHMHATARKHFQIASIASCDFDSSHVRRAVMNDTEAVMNKYSDKIDSTGFALFQGKRMYMEDRVAIQYDPTLCITMYAVIDGHLGTATADFVVANLFSILTKQLYKVSSVSVEKRQQMEEIALRQTFLEIQAMSMKSRPHEDSVDFSGATLTVIVLFDDSNRFISANVGDSRAILLNLDQKPRIVQLSQDHVPDSEFERQRIESNGGFVFFAGLWRVVGQLAVSRSLGDHHLRKYISAIPYIQHSTNHDAPVPHARRVIVMATDGLWNVMTNEEVHMYVSAYVKHRLWIDRAQFLQELSISLTIEAYVRGSLDNISVMIIAI